MADTTTTNPAAATGSTAAIPVGGVTGRQESLANWVGPYVTEMLGRGQALASQPYQAYMGPLTAGASNLQQQASQGLGSLTTPQAMTDAANRAGDIAQTLGGASFSPTTFGNQFTAPQEYQQGTFQNRFQTPQEYQAAVIGNQFAAPGTYESGTFENQFQSPADIYRAQDITTETFTPEMAQRYMNPYLQQALDPQIAEARRQAQIQRMQEAGRLSQAGAFGGSRQAIMESEGSRNLLQNLANITGQGYNTAFQQAGEMFTSDQARALQAAQANQAARQAAGQQALSAAQLQAQFGLSAQQAQEASRQFAAQQGMTAAQLGAQYGLAGLQASEASRQFGAQQGMTAAQLQAQYGLSADQAAELSRQFAAQQGMTAAQQAAQYGLAGQQASEQSKQFGAQFGLSALRDELGAAQAQSALARAGLQSDLDIARQQAELGAVERGITSEGIKADIAQFEKERLDPYSQVQFMQSLLQGMPVSAMSYTTKEPTALQSASAGAAGVADIIDQLRKYGIIS